MVFNVGSSNYEVSKALGIEYKDSTDLMSGMVFALDDKIVYKERLPYNPEKANKLSFQFEEGTCTIITPDNSTLKCDRENIDGKYYYTVYLTK